MRAAEQEWFRKSGTRSIDAMERAAQALARAIERELPAGARVAFACGAGGNGGDGTACARLLCGRYRCAIVQPSPPRNADAAINLERARGCGIPVAASADKIVQPDAWVDALFGTGLSRAPDGAEAELIRRINADRARGARVYAADIPSGLDGRTGTAFEPCVRADRTVSFQYLKTGMALADGIETSGAVETADVGFPAFPVDAFDAWLLDAGDVPRLLPPRRRNLHKGQCGHLLIVAGSSGMAGAAIMCARAALRSGAGLVTVACPKSIVPLLQALAPQAMCAPLDERDGAISAGALPALADVLHGKDAIAIGCGLSRRAAPEIVRMALASGVPAVVDADALNLLSEHAGLLEQLRPHHILTPHPGEARRLLCAAARTPPAVSHGAASPEAQREDAPVETARDPDALLADPIAAAHALSGLGATALLKGAACVACGVACGAAGTDGARETYVSASGCCGMARGGSGDVLTGIMGALLAERSERPLALTAALASEVHGRAGERAQARYGDRAMNAGDIPDFLPEAFRT